MRRFLFVNGTHPDESHVSALRVALLGRAIARQGHEVYLLTRQRAAGTETASDDPNAQKCETVHFCVIEEDSAGGRLVHIVVPGRFSRAFQMPTALRKFNTLVNWLHGCPTDPRWVSSAETLLEQSLAGVPIDLAWATFTPIESWIIAQRFARKRGIPFIADIKDDWPYYVPRGLRRLVAARAASAVALTANSIYHWDGFPQDQRRRCVIYSGYWREDIQSAQKNGANAALTGVFSGHVNRAAYEQIIGYIRAWSKERQHPVHLRYFGSRYVEIERMSSHQSHEYFTLTAHRHIAPQQLIEEYRRADFNFYVRKPNWAIHHKATELMAAAKPILVWGCETQEILGLAERAGVPMFVSQSKEQVYIALDRLATRDVSSGTKDLDWLCWENQAALLLEVFEETLAERTAT